MRGKTFITPKTADSLTIHLSDREMNEKLIILGKRLDSNLSIVVTELVKEIIDQKVAESERSQFEMLNEEAKVDLIIELRRKLAEAEKGGTANA